MPNISENPVRKARKSLGLTAFQLAARAGVSSSCLQVTEYSTPQNIPAALAAYLSKHTGIPEEELQRQYKSFRDALQAE